MVNVCKHMNAPYDVHRAVLTCSQHLIYESKNIENILKQDSHTGTCNSIFSEILSILLDTIFPYATSGQLVLCVHIFSVPVIFFLIFIGSVFLPLSVVMQHKVSEGVEVTVACLSSTKSTNYKT